MNSQTRDLYNSWAHQCLCAIIEQAEDKENFSDLLVQGIEDIETQLIEEEGVDEEDVALHTERIVGILDEVLENEAITDEAIENSDFMSKSIPLLLFIFLMNLSFFSSIILIAVFSISFSSSKS